MTGKSFARSTVFTALFAALTAAAGFISFPLPGGVPIVLQNMMTVLNGLLLGPWAGTAATALFVAVGVAGLPVFSGGTGGIVKLTGPTGGFIAGYVIASLVAGLIAGRPKAGRKTPVFLIALASVAAFVSIYVPGVFHFIRLKGCTFAEAMAYTVTPFIIGDAIKAVLCVLLSIPLRKTAAIYIYGDSDDDKG